MMSTVRISDAPRPRTVLLTGSTGLLGSHLLRVLLESGHTVLAMARPRDRFSGDRISGAERISRILHRFGVTPAPGQLRVVACENLQGLRWALDREPRPDATIHAAAAVKFDSTFRQLMDQNVTFTQGLLDLLACCVPRAHFHFVSTAYVCGVHDGVFRETDSQVPNAFHHRYEETKWLAERLVTDHFVASGRGFTIHRPSIIAGASEDGRAANFNGIYAFLRAADALGRRAGGPGFSGGGGRVVCSPSSKKNIVPVDWVAASIVSLMGDESSGGTFHLTHPRPITQARLIEIVSELAGFRLVADPRPQRDAAPTRAQRRLDASLQRFRPYLWDEAVFDRTRLEKVLGLAAEPPQVDRAYFARIFEFARSCAWRPYALEEAVPAQRDTLAYQGPCHLGETETCVP